MTLRSYQTLFSVLALSVVCLLTAADWRQFRGNDNTNVSTEKNIPITWSDTENTAWKIPLPGRGASGPIVIGDKVVLTCSSGPKQQRMHVVCFHTDTGKQLWHRQFWATGRTLAHPSSCNAAPTPASDGERIYAFYSSNDLVCLDLEGNLIWYRGLTHDYPAAGNDVGMSSSPLVIGKTVIVQVENQGDSFAAGINTATGETRWRKSRDRVANWASPVVYRGKSPRNGPRPATIARLGTCRPRSPLGRATMEIPCDLQGHSLSSRLRQDRFDSQQRSHRTPAQGQCRRTGNALAVGPIEP